VQPDGGEEEGGSQAMTTRGVEGAAAIGQHGTRAEDHTGGGGSRRGGNMGHGPLCTDCFLAGPNEQCKFQFIQ
jgi:hypothetical protein